MLTALKHFMTLNPNIDEIIQTFCTPGHSSIQEVDNVHSHIEKALNLSEIYDPESFSRILSKVRPNVSKLLQWKQQDFLNFQKVRVLDSQIFHLQK